MIGLDFGIFLGGVLVIEQVFGWPGIGQQMWNAISANDIPVVMGTVIGELDQVLRQLVSRTFTLDEVTSLCDLDGSRAIQSFDDLDMGDYQRVLETPNDGRN